MPDVERVTASYSRKVQLSQFEPVEHSVTLEAVPFDHESTADAYQELADEAEELVEQEIARRVAQKKIESDDED